MYLVLRVAIRQKNVGENKIRLPKLRNCKNTFLENVSVFCHGEELFGFDVNIFDLNVESERNVPDSCFCTITLKF